MTSLYPRPTLAPLCPGAEATLAWTWPGADLSRRRTGWCCRSATQYRSPWPSLQANLVIPGRSRCLHLWSLQFWGHNIWSDQHQRLELARKGKIKHLILSATDLLPALAEAAEEVLEDAAKSGHLSSGGQRVGGLGGLLVVGGLGWIYRRWWWNSC